ncbi:MAG TPA: diacylglycerol kinase family protein [Tepidisphaeraceae bacterium]|jgi:diacylglycerol kinase family enzyme
MKVIVLRNAAAGSAAGPIDPTERELLDAFASAGVAVEIRRVPPERLTATASDLAAHAIDDLVIAAAGGDGTLSAIAAALAGTSTAMGVLPMGTLNHFAKDLGLPLSIADSARAIATGQPRPVDVAEVNGRVFINNASIGLYPRVVRHRDQMRQRLGHGKWYAMLKAIVTIFRRFPLVRLRLVVNREAWLRTTPFVFVGNNQYAIERLNLGSRPRLDTGDLCVYFTNRTGRLGMLRLAFRALLGRLKQDKDFNALCTTELFIDTPRRQISVALDGEVHRLATPLHFTTRPAALKVMMPPD